jgi:hypothetical protein
MPNSPKLLAWIEPRADDEFMAAFVASATPHRPPATQWCSTPEEARQWINDEAAALGAPVEWVSPREH